MKPQVRTVYRCPRNGEVIECSACYRPHPHRVEALIAPGQSVPVCEDHGVRLVAR